MDELSERKKIILAAVVDLYVKTGEPVGSKGLISETGLKVSSATVRNEMNELAVLGYLTQPHISAGRVPTQKGYRYYVDNLMQSKPVDDYTKRLIDSTILSASGDPEMLVNRARQLLADISECACISTAPSGEKNFIRRIELVPVGPYTAMMVLLTSKGLLKSSLCRLDCELNSRILEKFYNIVDSHILGNPAGDISTATIQTIAASVDDDYFVMLPLMACISDLASSTNDAKYILAGSSNLLSLKDYDGRAADLIEFLNRREPITQVIRSSKGPVDIKIGTENKFKQLEDSSVIIAKYNIDGDDSGSLGVIGPTRMNYEQVISGAKYLTDLLGRLISAALEE